jgi:DNA invertase Pin-like site-specific DNA recombinase
VCTTYVQMEGKMTAYGYARVSTADQNLDTQLEQLRAAGCAKVFRERASGARSDRPELAKLLKVLGQSDTLIVSRLDRLARSTRDLLNILAAIGGRRATFKSLGDAWADTTTAHGRLMLTILGGLAEFERELICKRTGEGRTRAMANGVKFGRKPKLTPHQRAEALARREAGESMTAIARSYDVSHSMISRLSRVNESETRVFPFPSFESLKPPLCGDSFNHK